MLAIAVLAADIAGTLDLDDVSEVRVRATPPVGQVGPTPPGTAPPRGIDVLTRPEARIAMTDRRWDYGLSYAASFILPDLEQGPQPQLLQLGGVRVSWHDRFLRVTVSQDATYGIENSAYLLPTVQPVPGQPTPLTTAAPATAVTFGYSRSAAIATLRFDRLTQGSLGVEYLLSGGLDAISQQSLPEQKGPRATAELAHTLTRSDTLITAAFAQRAEFSAGPCATTTLPAGSTCQLSDQLAQLTEAIRHKMSRSDTVTLAGGAAVAAVSYQPGTPYTTGYYPVVEGSWASLLGDRGASTLTVYARYAPYMDVRTGIVLSTLSGEVRAADQISPDLVLHLTTVVGQSLPASDPSASTFVRGELGLDYHVSKRVDFTIGERWLWQQGQNAVGSLLSAYGLLAVTVRERTLHF
jgi:hypothetical protein